MKILLSLIGILIFSSIVKAQTVGIGVQPSIIEITLSPQNSSIPVKFRLFNEGDINSSYRIVPEENLKPFIYYNCSLEPSPYWCENKEIFIEPQGQKYIQILFLRKTSTAQTINSNLNLYVYGIPYYSHDNISLKIVPNVKITIKLKQIGTLPTTTTTTTTIKPFEPLTNTTTTSTLTTTTTSSLTTTTSIGEFRPLTEEERRRLEEQITGTTIPEEEKETIELTSKDYLITIGVIIICIGCCLAMVLGFKRYKKSKEKEVEEAKESLQPSYYQVIE